MTSLGSSGQSSTEYTVRVPKNTNKKYNVMAFNSGDKINFSTWTQAKMERDLSNKRMFQDEEAPETGAGSEFGKKLREVSRRKKFGIVPREFKLEDQPWLLRVNGKSGRKFKGQKKGGVTDNACYYIFTQCPDGAFEAFPVHTWYNFSTVARHRTLTAEEAEEEWDRRNKVVNHFSIMLQRRLKDQDRDDGDDEEEDKDKGKGKGKGKGKKKKGSELKIHDLEDDLEMSSTDESNESEEGDGDSKPKKAAADEKNKTKTNKPTKKKKRKKSGSDSEAIEDSDDGDFEGLEVDYMSESSSEEDESEKVKPNKGQNVPKGIDEASDSSEESEEEKKEEKEEEQEEEEENEEEGKKTPIQQEKKKKKDSSDDSDSSEDSDIDGETASALFMLRRKTPPKRPGGKGSAGSSRAGSRPGTPSLDSGSTSSTLRAAASKLEQGGKRQGGPDTPAAKRLKMEPNAQSPSGKSTPQPPSGKCTPSSSDVHLTEEAVRRYLIRKPMTTKDLLKKFQTKRTGLSSEQTVNVLAQILKRLNPERKSIADKMHFYIKQ
ncbi:general transcription factor IIF subunit 1 [Polyodon spathula]|uniref:general transcription factor IIF subunit 1 n=1 Tax=Polyodon spathula TaxID=7913 RepID=UPI001B7E365F|nr:general transcription factor IIF subunit 1 [Polyodon spathula]